MKKIISWLVSLTLIGTVTNSLVSCTGVDPFGGGGDQPTPSPIPHDVKYYQNLITRTMQRINSIEKSIKEFAQHKNDPNWFPTPADYQKTIDFMYISLYQNVVTFNDAEYQILFITNNGVFSDQTKILVKWYLENELLALNQQYNLEKKYPDDFYQDNLKTLLTTINEVKKLINNLQLTRSTN